MNNQEHGYISLKMPIELFKQLTEPDIINKLEELGISIADAYVPESHVAMIKENIKNKPNYLDNDGYELDGYNKNYIKPYNQKIDDIKNAIHQSFKESKGHIDDYIKSKSGEKAILNGKDLDHKHPLGYWPINESKDNDLDKRWVDFLKSQKADLKNELKNELIAKYIKDKIEDIKQDNGDSKDSEGYPMGYSKKPNPLITEDKNPPGSLTEQEKWVYTSSTYAKKKKADNVNGKILKEIQEKAKKLLTEKTGVNDFNNSLQIDHYEYVPNPDRWNAAPVYEDFVDFKPYPAEMPRNELRAEIGTQPSELKDLKDLPIDIVKGKIQKATYEYNANKYGDPVDLARPKYPLDYYAEDYAEDQVQEVSEEARKELDNIFDDVFVFQEKNNERPATHKQINYLKKLGYNGKTPKSQSEASKLINEYKNKSYPANAVHRLPATYKQREFLKKLGYSGSFDGMTLKVASALIDELIAKSM